MVIGPPQDEWHRRVVLAETPKLICLIIAYSGGVIKNTQQAVYVLWVFVVVGMAISFYLVFRNGGEIQHIENPSDLIETNTTF